jgi:hypothetical protein
MKIEATVKEFIRQVNSKEKIGFAMVSYIKQYSSNLIKMQAKPSASNSYLLRNEIHLGKTTKHSHLFSETSALNFSRSTVHLLFYFSPSNWYYYSLESVGFRP